MSPPSSTASAGSAAFHGRSAGAAASSLTASANACANAAANGASSSANLPSAAAAEPKPLVVTELGPAAEGKAAEQEDADGAKPSYVVEEASDEDEAEEGGAQVEWGADAKQEVTVAQYSEIVDMDVKF